MKKLLLIVLLIVGCDNTTGSKYSGIVGVWKWVETTIGEENETTITVPDGENQSTLIYNADGTLSYTALNNGIEKTGNGTYSINNDILTEIYDDDRTEIHNITIVDINIVIFSFTSGDSNDITTYYKYQKR